MRRPGVSRSDARLGLVAECNPRARLKMTDDICHHGTPQNRDTQVLISNQVGPFVIGPGFHKMQLGTGIRVCCPPVRMARSKASRPPVAGRIPPSSSYGTRDV